MELQIPSSDSVHNYVFIVIQRFRKTLHCVYFSIMHACVHTCPSLAVSVAFRSETDEVLEHLKYSIT